MKDFATMSDGELKGIANKGGQGWQAAQDELKRRSAVEPSKLDKFLNRDGRKSVEVSPEEREEFLNEMKAEEVREELKSNPVNPRTEISADAEYIAKTTLAASGRIVKHLWIIFVLLPVVLGILIAIAK